MLTPDAKTVTFRAPVSSNIKTVNAPSILMISNRFGHSGSSLWGFSTNCGSFATEQLWIGLAFILYPLAYHVTETPGMGLSVKTRRVQPCDPSPVV